MPEIVAALLREIAWPFALVLAWVAGELGQNARPSEIRDLASGRVVREG